MFPEKPVKLACFPNVSQFCHSGSIVFSVNFVSKKQNLLSLHGRNISCLRAAWKHGKTRKQLRKPFFFVLPGLLELTKWMLVSRVGKGSKVFTVSQMNQHTISIGMPGNMGSNAIFWLIFVWNVKQPVWFRSTV